MKQLLQKDAGNLPGSTFYFCMNITSFEKGQRELLTILGLFIVTSCGGPSLGFENSVYGEKSLKLRGAVLAHVHIPGRGYGLPDQPLYDRWEKLGIKSVQFNTFAYQPNLKTTRLSWKDPTLGDAELLREMRRAKKRGFSVMLKPHIWVGDFSGQLWRNQIDFSDENKLRAWFSSYERFILHQAQLADQGGAAYFVVGTELARLIRYEKLWRNMIHSLQARDYAFKLGYSCEGWNAWNIKFWDALDFIGVNFYYGYKGPRTSPEKLRKFYASKLHAHYAHARDHGKPLILTELGFPSHARALTEPHFWPAADTPAAPALQIFAYRALRRALETAGYPEGIYIWKYVTTLDSYEAKYYNKGFILQGKPAEDEVRRIFLR